MLKFELNVPERKTLARRLEELTGIHPFYTRAPLYAYEIGSCTIDRDGNLLVEETGADAGVLRTLLEEGLIRGGEVVGAGSTAGGEPDAQAEGGEGTGDGAGVEAPAEPDAGTEAPAAGEEQAGDGIDMGMNFDLPMGRHTGVSLRNLLNLVYTRGPLIRKATGGEFHVADGLIEAIRDDACTYSVTNFLRTVSEYEAKNGPALEGLKLTAEAVSFTGFPRAENMDYLTAFGHLAVLMNEQAITQKRIQAKGVDDSNERYAMRTWFLRLGMNGDDFKQSRKLLMENLSGHTAFRTADQAERAKEKAARKRDELKAAKAAAQAEEGAQTGTEA